MLLLCLLILNMESMNEYLLMYGIMVLSIWESLFSYYRYYMTFAVTKHMHEPSIKYVLTRCPMAMFMFLFLALFVVEMHLFYWSFPLLLALFSLFNVYTIWGFAALLIEKYKVFIDLGDVVSAGRLSRNEDVLLSVVFMRNVSLISFLFQTASLSLAVTVSADILWVLPILWSVSSSILSLNFVRNRRYLQRRLIAVRQRCGCYAKGHTVKVNKIKMQSIDDVVPQYAPNSNSNRNPAESEDNNHGKYHQFDHEKIAEKPCFGASKSDNIPIAESIHTKPAKLQSLSVPFASSSDSHPPSVHADDDDHGHHQQSLRTPSSRSGKALSLLGIAAPSPSKSRSHTSRFRTFDFKSSPKQQQPQQPRASTPTASSLHAMPGDLKDLSLDMVPQQNGNMLGIVDGSGGHQRASTLMVAPMMRAQSLKLVSHASSNSAPVQNLLDEQQEMDIQDMMQSLHFLAKYGFCSRKSINSIQQLTRYQQTASKK